MPAMHPSIIIESVDPSSYGRQTRVKWVNDDFEIRGDNQIRHGGSGTGPDGFDLLGAALGQCLLNTLIANAKRDQLKLRSARAVVAMKSKLRGRGLAPYISDFHVDIWVDGDLTDRQRQELEVSTSALCGVRETLSQTPKIDERVHVGSPGEAATVAD